VPGRNGGEETLTVAMHIPTPYTVRTYGDNLSMTASDECDVVSVDVLVFAADEDNNNDNDLFLYREKGVNITNGDGNRKTFSVKMKKPSVPTNAGVFGEPEVSGGEITPVSYARRTYNANGYKSFMSEIYLAEHAKGGSGDDERPNNPCIVIGGRYGSPDANITYYRIDLVKNTFNETTGEVTKQDYLPVLRNHRYKVNITDVHGQRILPPSMGY
jgi:hypothetical protein